MKSTSKNSVQNKIFCWGVLSLWGAILVQIFILKPFYGLMDDSAFMTEFLPQIIKGGFWHSYLMFSAQDAAWGMFRPNLVPMVYSLYSVGAHFGPTTFFLFNACLVFLIIYLNAVAFSKLLNVDRWLIAVVALVFPYTYDLFQHPSMQEKLVMFFGSLLLIVCRNRSHHWVARLFVILFLSALGFGSKASFLIYVLMAFLVLAAEWVDQKKKSALIALFIVSFFDLGFTLFLKKISTHGAYTVRYSSENVANNLLTTHGLFYAALIVVATPLLLRGRPFRSNIRSLIGVSGILGFLIVFLPWSLEGYLQSIVSMPLAVTLAQLGQSHVQKRFSFAVPLLLMAAMVSTVRTEEMFNRLHDIGSIVNRADQFEARGLHEIFVPCHEGSESLRIDFQFYSKSTIQVSRLQSDSPLEGAGLFFDETMCKLDNPTLLHDCETEPLYTSRLASGYKLLKIVKCHSHTPPAGKGV